MYSILSVQLLVIFGTVALFNQSSEVQNLFLGPESDGTAFWVVLVGSAATGFVIILAMACSRTLRVVVPINFIMLAVFTVAQSLLLGLVLMFIKGEIVLVAAAATASVVIALTAFSFQTKIDFTICNGLMFCAIFVFILFGSLITIFAAIGGNMRTENLGEAAVQVLITSVYLVVDTQVIKLMC